MIIPLPRPKWRSHAHDQFVSEVIIYRNFHHTGRTNQAFEQYHAALQLNPKHSVALVNMARELRAAGNIQEAEKVYKRFALNEKRHIPVTNPQAEKL